MLEQKEAQALYHRLSQIVSGEGLDWLLRDVERQIALGTETTKKIKLEGKTQGYDLEHHPKRKGPPAKFIVTQPYSDREKLHILIEAVEATSVGLSLGMLDVYETIGEQLQNLDALGFAPDTGESQIKYVKRDLLEKKQAILRLSELLGELKEAI